MNYKRKRRIQVLKDYIIGWTIAFVFLSIVRGEGTVEEGSVQFVLWRAIAFSFVFGPFFGTISGLGQIYSEERIYRRVSILKMILARKAFAFSYMTALIVIAYLVVTTFFGVKVGFLRFVFEPGSFAIYLYILSVELFMLLLSQVKLMFGPGVLWKLVSAQFYYPKEEERIFMFLDLRSSTTIAEKLGHIRYSRLIQDCFNDLGIVEQHQAAIYQYVGDEVILTWELKEGIKSGNCIKAFFAFQNQLKVRKAYYQKEYQVQPVFKAGLHFGRVTVSEVGKYKREIAYHGDAINTAARIQGKCNEFKKDFLISRKLLDRLEPKGIETEEIGFVELKGKEEKVEVLSITHNT